MNLYLKKEKEKEKEKEVNGSFTYLFVCFS